MPPKRTTLSGTRGKPRSSLSSSLKPSSTKPTNTALSAKPTPSTNPSSARRSPSSGSDAKLQAERWKESEGRETLDVDDEQWDSIWKKTKQVMGGVRPVHAQGQNRIQHILRVFDLDPSYGPCIGLTRLERWHRAHELGEEPPQEVLEILNTKEGVLQYRDCVFADHGL